MDWLPKQCSKHKWAPKTYESNLSTIQNLIIPYIGSMEMQKLKPYHMENLYTTLSKTPCGSYIEGKKQELTEKQKLYHERTKVRDLAMMSLLLGTGIRVSECVGLNINDIDLDTCGARVYRKGGKESVIYFSDEVRDVLENYLDEREMIDAVPGNEDALFLSMQRKRINVRSVENLVKKYAKLVTPLKKITPHKLRSTYGTSLYRETGDIYLVASVLGHNDVNTTRKHYAAQEEERRRSARNVVKLREEH